MGEGQKLDVREMVDLVSKLIVIRCHSCLQIATEYQGDKQFYSKADIARCMEQTVAVDLNQPTEASATGTSHTQRAQAVSHGTPAY